MKNFKRFFLFMLLIVAMFLVGACGSKSDLDDSQKDSQMNQHDTENTEIGNTETADVVEEAPNCNLLTGVADLTDGAIGKRPVAVMVNNIKPAFPQYGVAQADIIFEVPVEGGQTRFMAIYGDYTQVPKICSVRSCRKYFPAIAGGFDAIYVHWGMDEGIVADVNAMGVTRYNGTYNDGGLFARDQARLNAGYSLEHTGYFDGTGFAEVLVEDKVRLDIETDKTGTAFKFNAVDTVVKPTGESCTTFNVKFGTATSTFIYDEATNTYLKQHNSEPHMDGVTNTQLAFTNVFVLETSITTDTNGVHKKIDLTGGNGYYVSNGAIQRITWEKGDVHSPIKLYDVAGNELSINRGKSYFAINNSDRTTFE